MPELLNISFISLIKCGVFPKILLFFVLPQINESNTAQRSVVPSSWFIVLYV